MNKIKSILDYLNGKKTLIGTLLFFVAIQAQQYGLVNTDLLKSLDSYAQQIATVIAVIGLMHKGVKVVEK